jgi:quercetin dioxygenase-like cupin family protein
MKRAQDGRASMFGLKPVALAAMISAFLFIPGVGAAAPAQHDGVTTAFHEAIPNIPGKSLIGVVVDYAPGGKTPPHHHARSAFITGYVLSGAIRSQVDGGKPQVFHAGESFFENPGAHHRISENASATEPARLLAIFVVDTSDTELTTIDKP